MLNINDLHKIIKYCLIAALCIIVLKITSYNYLLSILIDKLLIRLINNKTFIINSKIVVKRVFRSSKRYKNILIIKYNKSKFVKMIKLIFNYILFACLIFIKVYILVIFFVLHVIETIIRLKKINCTCNMKLCDCKTCCICLEDKTNAVYLHKSSHFVCSKCYFKLKINRVNTCPLCRTEFN